MKKSRFTESQIVSILKEYEKERDIQFIVREYEMLVALATSCNWCNKYGDMGMFQLKKLKELEIENCRLKQIQTN